MYDIEVQNVTMKFNLETQGITSIKEYMIKLLQRQLHYEEFIALRDVSFNLKRGESLGIIGGNGAGKSTLLKCVAGVYKPSSGSVTIHGNVAPLIELGAGFDAELTGRENIYLNGAVLGYSKEFMQEKYKEIVGFSGLENFIDVPIRNYSSGMKARLGFSIATMIKPQILIVDEILGVGDYAFQEKCHKRIERLLSDGTTLLFVSHSDAQVADICDRAIWLKKGEMAADGDVNAVYQEYKQWANAQNGVV